MRGGLAIDGGIQRQNDLGHLRRVGARHQLVDGEILRADAVERRQRCTEHMIAAIGRIGAFQRPEIGDIGDHDDDRGIAARIGAHRAGVLCIDVSAGLADLDLVDRDLQRRGQRRHQRFALLDQMQRRAPRRTRTQARQPRQQLDQAFNLGAGDACGHLGRTKSRRQAEPTGERHHLLLHRRLGLAAGIAMRRDQEILE
ncbi:hypothetical protein chiPu_0031862, partial [Chiloscyllium punctatum]|nr:hypothetical protein [Chiloscyllium punctatum]